MPIHNRTTKPSIKTTLISSVSPKPNKALLFKLAYPSKTKSKILSIDLPIDQITNLAKQVSGSVIKFSRVEVQS